MLWKNGTDRHVQRQLLPRGILDHQLTTTLEVVLEVIDRQLFADALPRACRRLDLIVLERVDH